MVFPVTRMRRYRKNSKIRDIVRETKLDKEDLIYPIFFKEEPKKNFRVMKKNRLNLCLVNTDIH